MFSETNKPAFEDDNWSLVERQFEKDTNRAWETLFSLGNGYVGTRGSFEEGLPGFSTEGTFINGFYESFPLFYEEGFPGYAKTGQRILNLANAKAIRLVFEDGEVYDPLAPGSEISDYCRKLDMRTGLLTRELTWTSPIGKRLHLLSERLVSLALPHVIAQRLTITPQANCGGTLWLSSLIDTQPRREQNQENDPRSASGQDKIKVSVENVEITGQGAFLIQRTSHSQIAAACGLCDHLPDRRVLETVRIDEAGKCFGHAYQVPADQPVVLEKYIAYCTSFDTRPDGLAEQVRDELENARALGFDRLCAEQAAELKRFWAAADISITADNPLLQGAIRLNMFHLFQSAGRDGHTSIPAKGLTADGYDGHYFWDTESYMLPFFLYTVPEIARKLLEYRFNTLDRARRRASDLSHPGALFAWRTINGDECSANYPTGTAQYHIDADIAFAIRRYYKATDDHDFMLRYGAAILFETARLWRDLGEFVPRDGGLFRICGVTGPDEYTTLVDNNTYTNLAAQANLALAVEIAHWIEKEHPDLYPAFGLGKDEPAGWQEAAARMLIPGPVQVKVGNQTEAIMPQDDTFLTRPDWDERRGSLRGEKPLLLRYHPLVYNRSQVCKQADLVLAEFMFGHLVDLFSREQKRRDFDYYERRTTHDSSLSRCIFSIMAAELADPPVAGATTNYLEAAAEFYRISATIDLVDERDETKNGIHAANMGGSWMGIIFGFARMRIHLGRLSFWPVLPAGWTAYTFKVFYQGRRVQVEVSSASSRPRAVLTLLEGEPLDMFLYNQPKHLELNVPVE